LKAKSIVPKEIRKFPNDEKISSSHLKSKDPQVLDSKMKGRGKSVKTLDTKAGKELGKEEG